MCAYYDITLVSLASHESFEDMIGTIQAVNSRMQATVANHLLRMWSEITSADLKASLKHLEFLEQRLSQYHYQRELRSRESHHIELKTLLVGINAHKQSLCDFLLYRAANSESLDDQWRWDFGDAIPKMPKVSSDNEPNNELAEFQIPDEFLCAISRELMDDPVITSDGFTYDRNNIER